MIPWRYRYDLKNEGWNDSQTQNSTEVHPLHHYIHHTSDLEYIYTWYKQNEESVVIIIVMALAVSIHDQKSHHHGWQWWWWWHHVNDDPTV